MTTPIEAKELVASIEAAFQADQRIRDNARQLLVALQGILGDVTCSGLHRMEQADIDAARAAIARATGES